MSPSVSDLRKAGAAALASAGIEAAVLEADLLLEAVLNQNRSWLLTHPTLEVPALECQVFMDYLARRQTQEPLAYILGKAGFYGKDFTITPGVLIPRADTETVIEAVLALFSHPADLKSFAEVGVGSGVIAITLLSLFPAARGVGTDTSPAALGCAQGNAQHHDVQGRLALWSASLLEGAAGPFDLVVSNPPYIPTYDIPHLDKTVAAFEPHLALDGGDDGLEVYRQLIPQALRRLVPGGWCVLEHGYNQAEAVGTLFAAAGLTGMLSFKDLGGHTRVTAARRG